MPAISAGAAAARPYPGRLTSRIPRRLALLGGTATLGDSLVALRYLADPRALVRGPAIAEYERAFAERIGARHGLSFSSGRVGLYGILRALGIGPGDEVLLQVPTHIVVANAIRYTGASPVYVDCRLDTYNMDLDEAERRVTPRTRAVVLQHTFGIPADLDAALDLARRHNLELIEDCVHALGATYDGRPVGTFGRAAFFSTEETKTISTTMGGMVTTDDPDLAARLRDFQSSAAWPPAALTARYVLKFALYYYLTEPRVHALTRPLYEGLGRRNPLPQATTHAEMAGERPAGYEQVLSNGQAAIGLRQLRRLDANLAHRRAIASLYRQQLAALGVEGPQPPAGAEPAYARYPVWVEDRQRVVRAAARHAVLGSWFTSVLEEAAAPAAGGYQMGSCPRAEAVARHLVNLPTHLRVGPRDVDALVAVLAGAVPAKAVVG